MAFSGAQVTRLGLYGGPRGLYGDFSGKAEQEITAVAGKPGRKRSDQRRKSRWYADVEARLRAQEAEPPTSPQELSRRLRRATRAGTAAADVDLAPPQQRVQIVNAKEAVRAAIEARRPKLNQPLIIDEQADEEALLRILLDAV